MSVKTPFWLSATKIVLISLSLATIALTFLRIIEAKDFVLGWMLVLGFYFGQKNSAQSTNNTVVQK